MARQFIYHMQGLTKAFSGGKKVLENINLSFYPDAKIGVLGPNGSGKSTLLKIMAGLDKEFSGEAWAAEGARVGYLPQEPELDPSLDVKGNVMLGVAGKKAIIDRYNELMMNYSDETAEEASKLQDEIESKNLRDLESRVEMSMDALGCPPGEAEVSTSRAEKNAASRSASCSSKSPTCCSSTSRPTISTRRPSAWLEKHLEFSRRRPDRHPRPLLPR